MTVSPPPWPARTSWLGLSSAIAFLAMALAPLDHEDEVVAVGSVAGRGAERRIVGAEDRPRAGAAGDQADAPAAQLLFQGDGDLGAALGQRGVLDVEGAPAVPRVEGGDREGSGGDACRGERGVGRKRDPLR